VPDTLARQRSLAALILDPAVPEEGHPLAVYRDLVRMSLVDPVEAMFPIAKALLEEEGVWQELLDGFLAARCVPSTHYRDVAPAFLGWCALDRTGLDRWPFLLELLHFELLETLVCRYPDLPAPPGLTAEPGLGSRAVLAPATQVVTYGHAVHRCTEEAPRPRQAATHLLAFRDGDDSVAVGLERVGHHLAQILFVFDHEHRVSHRGSLYRAGETLRGTVTRNVVPSAALERTSMRPP